MSTKGMASLKWGKDTGFELDLDAELDGVHARLIDMPVRVDGTDTLHAGQVRLHHLDVLFKAHVDWDGAPGQLHDAHIRLIDDSVELMAKVEDAETGAEREVHAMVPVRITPSAPSSGGVVLPAPEEDDLDWDDESTVERMFGDMPLPSPSHDDMSDELSDEAPAGPPVKAKPASGLDALLKALATPEFDDVTGEIPIGAAKALANAAVRKVVKVAEPVAAAVKSMVDGPPPAYSLEQEARSFLKILLDREQLELTDPARLTELLSGVGPILASRRSAEAKATELSNWLLGQDAVEELYIDDEDLAQLLEQW